MKLNPYRVAASIALDRLTWDLHPISWLSRRNLKSLKDKKKDQRAVILCNGPSLLKTDFSLLENVYTFGLNKINLLFQDVDFRPNTIVAVNPYVIKQNKAFYKETNIPLFLDAKASRKEALLGIRNSSFIHTSDFPFFSEDCSMSLYQGYTVTYVAMQLAYHMGFQEVALIGCDHNFATTGPANELRTAEGEDKSHFHKDYFTDGQQWQLPDLRQSEAFYELAENHFLKAGRRLVNATEGGKLEVLPRVTLDEFVQHEASV
ncbi:6-hydroxymethylpterin diphosphokinase MptE-like protein [Marinibactrum halimedae]|uniref:6-hydroxymethylpterin diphosphokinase MptE-like domain-containing protein n=1 Tax=Marinibactrum halimedae TaxID=1444977 RepID=A0AA37T540_9GAMM|nr:6-hydroxymethylpterin diphosphokinase MptE-like protein [Marinibactrum halimedae]MCD9459837.1 DUF115 domain-containing protein [Marinibactrum halimedae]GLS26969.1 hypothetical protein GCM10007877_26880 [Marinibactrum halimedae]